ncbi:Bug family tripartite tricarboxylate transporter substrate binding protein [Cupriavidus sp. 30B13]|uniref:Bug family tripartite tricarboxylate transporter substrate binding protein n=1 Tax=Cupriavidus sp. 30B13 TaxID=3384241 RepID=UPI003B8FA841
MIKQRRDFISGLAVLGGAALLPGLARAGKPFQYPVDPVNVVIPFTAGGSTDYMGRLIMADVGARHGGKFIPENRPGASGSIGTASVLRARADGNTLLYSTASFLTNILLYKDLPYDPLRDFTPVARTVQLPLVLIVGRELGVKSIQELVEYLKRNQQTASYGTYGIGTSSHVSASIFLKKIGLPSILHVPYKDNRISTDLVVNRLTFMMEAWSVAAPMIQSGRFVPLAVTSDQPLPFNPRLPTVSSFIKDKFNLVSWHGLFARKGTPDEIVEFLNREVAHSLEKDQIQKSIVDMGFLKYPPLSRAAFSTFLTDELARWKGFMAEAGVSLI